MVAGWYQLRGWPHAYSKGASEGGMDVENMPALAPEVKATSDGDLLGALRQAQRNAKGGLPFVVWRPNGYGPERIGEWVVAMTLSDHTRLLQDAGYGDGEPKGEAA